MKGIHIYLIHKKQVINFALSLKYNIITERKIHNMPRNLLSIDIAKYIASVCVVAIHIFNTSSINNTTEFLFINGIARLSVPFFFCCTGYFLAEKGFENRKIIVSYIKKLLKTYFILSLIYIPIEIIKMIGTDTFNTKHIINYLHIIIVEGSFLHLWYFPATIFAVWFIHILFKRISFKYLCLASIFLYFIGVLGDGYAGTLILFPDWLQTIMRKYKTYFISTRNGLFFGFPFVIVGVAIFRNKNILNKFTFLPWFIISIIVVCIETFFLGKFNIAEDYNMIISIFPATIFLFCTLLKMRISSTYNKVNWRHYSSIIYESHLIFYGTLLSIIQLYNTESLDTKIVQFIIVLTGTHILSWLISHKKQIQLY